jgi:dUTP pyrophosphatase
MQEVTGNIIAGKLTKKYPFDAGQDVYSNEEKWIYPRDSEIIHTGLFIEVPKGFVGLLWPRSGLSCNNKIEVGAGCIDYGYKDEVMVHLYNNSRSAFHILPGMKITQLLTIPVVTLPYRQVKTWTEATERELNGFGSSGNF